MTRVEDMEKSTARPRGIHPGGRKFWCPKDGPQYHTLTVSADGKTLTSTCRKCGGFDTFFKLGNDRWVWSNFEGTFSRLFDYLVEQERAKIFRERHPEPVKPKRKPRLPRLRHKERAVLEEISDF
jgi:hypothetical protein